MDGVSVLIQKGKKYLMIQQPETKPLPCRWFAPSGAKEEGETIEQAARREVKEETGLEIEGIKELAVIKSDWKTERTHFLLARWKSGRVRPDLREINSYGWFSYEQILKLELMPATSAFFERHFRGF